MKQKQSLQKRKLLRKKFLTAPVFLIARTVISMIGIARCSGKPLRQTVPVEMTAIELLTMLLTVKHLKKLLQKLVLAK